MNIPANPDLKYIAVALLLLGLFLFVSGLNIVSIDKVSVSKGFKTWFIGLILMGGGLYLMFPSENPNKITKPIANNKSVKLETTISKIENREGNLNTELNHQVLKVKSSNKTKYYQGSWNGKSINVYIMWENYSGQGAGVDMVIESTSGELLKVFKGVNYSYRKLKMISSDNTEMYLAATSAENIKIWSNSNNSINFSRKYK